LLAALQPFKTIAFLLPPFLTIVLKYSSGISQGVENILYLSIKDSLKKERRKVDHARRHCRKSWLKSASEC
jgi:hypothetical protein